MPQTIKIMPDYDCHPLWGMDSDNIGNIDPSSLPISEGLRRSLDAWAQTFDNTLNRQDPIRSGFADESVERAFDSEGRRLWKQLIAELHGSFVVKYFSIMEKKLLDPDQYTK